MEKVTTLAIEVRAIRKTDIGLYTSVGFQTEGVVKNYMLIDDNYYDGLIMSLFSPLS